ncbi:T9SS type A sorting domain-containing protein [Hyphobacterium sp. CCMP332]|nr:T9SS type A sorting domain-containing protein [Hyphobacterium sp. CCMP332]
MSKNAFILISSFFLLLSYSAIGQGNQNSIGVFPNPLFDKATLEIHIENVSPTEIVLFNIIGKEIHRQKLSGLGQNSRFEVDFSFLNPGVYFLSLISKRETIATKKIVKKG